MGCLCCSAADDAPVTLDFVNDLRGEAALTFLLDVNILIALMDPATAAMTPRSDWFEQDGREPRATSSERKWREPGRRSSAVCWRAWIS